jgi:hypothetical protein
VSGLDSVCLVGFIVVLELCRQRITKGEEYEPYVLKPCAECNRSFKAFHHKNLPCGERSRVTLLADPGGKRNPRYWLVMYGYETWGG